MNFRRLSIAFLVGLMAVTSVTPAAGQVRSFTLGIDTNCPYSGLGE